MNNQENSNLTGPAPLPDNCFDKKKEKLEWNYYDNHKDFLLRYCLVDDDKIIRIEVITTKTVSINNEIYAQNYRRKDFIENLGYEENEDKNMDAFTILRMIFQEISVEGYFNGNDEFVLKIKKKEEISLIFKKGVCVCDDIIFINKNIKRKINQIKEGIDAKYNEFKKKNTELIEKNKDLKKELEKIQKINKELRISNEKVSKELKEVEEIQRKAIKQLTELV